MAFRAVKASFSWYLLCVEATYFKAYLRSSENKESWDLWQLIQKADLHLS